MLDEDGNETGRDISLNRGKNWEVLDAKNRDHVEVVVESHRMRTPNYIYEGKGKRGKRVPVNSNNGVVQNETEEVDNSKEARKAKRQARAKKSSNARAGHKRSAMKHNPHPTEEEEAALRGSDETSSTHSSDLDSDYDSENSSDGEQKLRVKVYSNVLGKEDRARILCYNCRDGHFWRAHELSGPRRKNKHSIMRDVEDNYDLRKKY